MAASQFAFSPKYKIYTDQIQYARQAQPKTLYYAEIDAACYDTVVEVVVGGRNIDTAITQLTDRINRITSGR
jgi:hypothetical protein